MLPLFRSVGLLGIGMLFLGCTRVPTGLQPVTGFDGQRYLGKWYEIARLDHSFERGLTNVTAEYAARPDGSISVANRGYDPRAGKWREARAVARFRGNSSVGSLRVCFFWPFWGGYHIIALDQKDYSYQHLPRLREAIQQELSRLGQGTHEDEELAGKKVA